MLLDIVNKGTTDYGATIRIVDSDGHTPETAVEHNTSGIDLWYRRQGAAKVSLTEVALAALTTAHTDGGIEHIGDGYYRLDLPDAALASGANYVDVGGTVTGMIVQGGRIKLVDYPPRVNKRIAPAYILPMSRRVDGVVTANRRVRIQAGETPDVALDFEPMYGRVLVESVAEPSVDPTGELTATVASGAGGPKDTMAVISLEGGQVAGSSYAVTAVVTMETGELVYGTFYVDCVEAPSA